MKISNPIIPMDYPNPDVIRVENTYYMLCNTQHFMPGGAILKSYDLAHWELINYLFEKLSDTPAERLEGEQSAYGKCMRQGSFCYHNGVYYILFYVPNTKTTYLYSTKDIEGIWEKHIINGRFHDGSLFFHDGRPFIVCGYRRIEIIELNMTLTGEQPGGIHKTIVVDEGESVVALEGCRMYEMNGKFYLFLMNWPRTGTNRRVQWCFISDKIDGEYHGYIVLDDDMGTKNQGISNGCLFDTPDKKWYSMAYQDCGAAGRFPVLIPVQWKDELPVFGDEGKAPQTLELQDTKTNYNYHPLYISDEFLSMQGDEKLSPIWQWNHQPNLDCYYIHEQNGLCIKTDKLCVNLVQAMNILTQRMYWPQSSVEVTVDVSELNNGDVAGICALIGGYGFVGITKEMGKYSLIMVARNARAKSVTDRSFDYMPGVEYERLPLDGTSVVLRISADFTDMKDIVEFSCKYNGRWRKIGIPHKVYFGLDHLAGCRYGLFIYSTQHIGGTARFNHFRYHVGED